MFTDSVKLKLFAGKGGNGVVAWRREKYIPKGGPYGGNGGQGGSVYFKCNSQIYSLDQYRNKRQLRAENGQSGGSNRKQGRHGKDLIIEVPCGTLIKNAETQEILYDLTEENEQVELCNGGRGGIGNFFFKSPTNQAPNKCTPGKPGQEADIELELKLIADVGFLGMPNAGKSTLLSHIAPTQVKTAAYPFTTLRPNLSYLQFDDYSRIYLADIPGIIKDAHQNRGLGLSFLRHIERCSVVIYIIDASGIDGRDPFDDLITLQEEVGKYNSEILKKPFLIALNKIDCEESAENLIAFREKFPSALLTEISALKGEGTPHLIERMRALAQKDGKRFT